MLYIIVCSFVAGILLTLFGQFLFLRRWFRSLPTVTSFWKPQTESYLLPKELSDALKDEALKKQKESCLNLNLVLQFLFQELKDTKRIRRWAMKRMKLEFEEMLRSTTGKLLEHITVRDFNLGRTFPIIQHASVENVSVNEDNVIEEVTLLLDLTYNGRFQLAVDVDMVFSKSAYLSVILTKLQGSARLQFTRQPYTHWSFSFIEDPTLQFEVESHFEGRPIAQLTSLIINQIRKAVRKKHTLPNYKIRYRPFFVMPVTETAPQDVYYQGNKISIGRLQVDVDGCSRLANITTDSQIYCSLTLDSIQWMELMSFRRKLWLAHDVEVIRVPSQNIGLSFGEVFLVDKYEEMVVVTDVTDGSPAAKADIHKSDLLMAINGVKVSNSKHAVRLMKNAGEKITLRMERAIKGFSGSGQKTSGTVARNNDEDTISLKAFNLSDSVGEQPSASNSQSGDLESADYVAVLPLPADLEKPLLDDSSSLQNTDSKSDALSIHSMSSASSASSAVPVSMPLNSASAVSASPPMPKKGLTQILTTGSNLFGRKKQKSEGFGGSAEQAKSQSHLLDKLPDARPPSKLDVRASDGQGLAKKDRKLLVNGGKVAGPGDLVAQPPVPQKEYQLNRKPESQGAAADSVDSRLRESSLHQQTNSASSSSYTDFAKMRATHYEKACSNPAFNEKFEFEVEEKHNYLNICVWNKQPEKVDRSRVIKPEKDVLLGHVSIPLMDIALECLTTLQGDVTNIYNITSSESKVETGRSQFANLASHSGFEERLCHGDVTLRFIYAMHSLSKKERENICKMKDDSELASGRDQTDAAKESQGLTRAYPSAVTSASSGQHHFMVTRFQTATYCHFCSNKIWLKTAFQCQLCQMVCHKKCTEKCQAQRQCSKLAKRFPKNEQLKNEEMPKNRIRTEDSMEEQKPDDTRLSDQAEEGEALIGDVERKRHNSAPDESLSDTDPQHPSESLSPTTSLPRTRSSNSLVEMPIEALTMPTAKYLEDAENLSKMFRRVQNAPNSDEMVVTEAKRKGKELFVDLEPEVRKQKLDSMILKLEVEINNETENRTDLIGKERLAKDKKVKKLLQEKIEKSDAKLQSMTVFMLHYCAGLQHCMDQEEMERQKRLEQDQVQQEQAEEELMEQKLAEQSVCELERTQLASEVEQSAVIKEADLQTDNIEDGFCADEIKADSPNEKIEDDYEADKIKTDASMCEIEAEPCATDDRSESSVELELKQDLEDENFDDEESLETKHGDETVAAVVDEAVISKPDRSTSETEFQPDENSDPLEVNAVESTRSLTETVGMSSPVSVCHLVDAEPDAMLGQLPPRIIEDSTVDISMLQVSTISPADDTPLAEEKAETADSEPPEMESVMLERVAASVSPEEFCRDSGTSELFNLPHSSIEPAVSEASVINTSNSCENLTSDDCDGRANMAQQVVMGSDLSATKGSNARPVELEHAMNKL